jgi:magnesium-transporting ATPase (P-type)
MQKLRTPRPQNHALQDGAHRETVAVTMNEILLRGCTLKNSGFIVGLVVYTGPESRIQMNAAEPPRKQGGWITHTMFARRWCRTEQICGSAGSASSHRCMRWASYASLDLSVVAISACLG